MVCARCGTETKVSDGIDCTECKKWFCDNCYDCERGDGCHCHKKNVLEGMSELEAADLVAQLEFGNAGVFNGRANPDIDVETLKERFKTKKERRKFIVEYTRAIQRKLEAHFGLEMA